MHRVFFEKTGDAVWISHLDVMRIFQRAFLRQQIPVAHTQGFSPHAFVSILLPLSVGTGSQCEILECTLEDQAISYEETARRLNRTLPEGIRVLQVYEAQRKAKELQYLQAEVRMEYDRAPAAEAGERLAALFARSSLIVEKKSKKGMTQVDIRPMIESIRVERPEETVLLLNTVVCAQNPSLNPDLMVKAIQTELPELTPDFFRTMRREVLDGEKKVFR